MVTAGIAFAVVFAIVFVPYWILVDRTEEREDRALKKRLKVRRTKAFSPAIVKAQAKLSSVEHFAAALIRGRSLFEPFARTIRQSGLNLTVGTIVLACGFIAVVAFFLTSRLVPSVWLAVAVAALSGSLPVLYVRRAARKRMEAFEEQFPEAIDLIARGLRAGHALTTTLQMVGDEVPDPVGAEFRLLFEQQNYGMSLGDALKAFADRVPIIDARFFVTALLTQREMGGNLSEVLDNLCFRDPRTFQGQTAGSGGERTWPDHRHCAGVSAARGRAGSLFHFALASSFADRRSAGRSDDHRRGCAYKSLACSRFGES